MAKAITQIDRKVPSREKIQAESLGEILKALSDNRKAIVSVLEIVKELQASGLFDILLAMLKNRAQLASVGLEFVHVANIPNMLKNIILMAQFLGRLDPLQTEKLISSIGSGLEQAMQNDDSKGLWGMFGALRDPHVKASISTAVNFLHGMGEQLDKKEETGQ